MSEEVTIKSSNMRPAKAGCSYIEVQLRCNDSATSGRMSAEIPLGKTYRSVKPVCVAAHPISNLAGDLGSAVNLGSYIDIMANVLVLDYSRIKLLFKSSSAVALKVIATLEVEE